MAKARKNADVRPTFVLPDYGGPLNPYGMRPPTYRQEPQSSAMYPTIAPAPTYRKHKDAQYHQGLDMNANALGEQFGDHPEACDYVTFEPQER